MDRLKKTQTTFDLIEKIKSKGCAYCGSLENLTIDHKHPIIKGGTNVEKNLQCLCRGCNTMKSDIPHGTLLRILVWYEGVRGKTRIMKKVLRKNSKKICNLQNKT